MTESDLPDVNFTFSEAAKQAIEALRVDHDSTFPDTPAGILGVSWGYVMGTDPFAGRVTIGFYSQSQSAEVAHGIQEVSGVEFIFYTTDKFAPLFEGKVLDHAEDRGFFLREP